MAFDKNVFATRAKTAIVYAAVMLVGLLWNEWSFFILFSIVHAGAWKEYLALSEKTIPLFQLQPWWKNIHFPLMGWGLMLMATSDVVHIGGLTFSMAGEWIVRITLVVLLLHLLVERKFRQTAVIVHAKGLLYISVSLALLMNIRSGWLWNSDHSTSVIAKMLSTFSGQVITLLIVFGIWINDTMAYIMGSLIGKTPLSKWSPKKTWEGTIGGIVLSVGLINLIAALAWNASIEVFCISLLTAIAGTFGDLYESKLKRNAGVKDSGTIMPGHGGFLDRFDSILFASPAVWVLCYLFYR
jgi:phosphatidate cytidylyltransferase